MKTYVLYSWSKENADLDLASRLMNEGPDLKELIEEAVDMIGLGHECEIQIKETGKLVAKTPEIISYYKKTH